MSTATDPLLLLSNTPLPMGARQPEKPPISRSAQQAWRDMIESGQYDNSIAAAAGCTEAEYASRRALLLRRREQHLILTVEVPKAEAAAAAAEAVVRRTMELLAAPIGDTVTAAEIRLMIALVDPKIPTGTPAELGRGLLTLAGDGPNAGVGRLRNRALELRHKAMDMRQRSEGFMLGTAHVPADTASQANQQQQSRLRRAIQERLPIINAAANAAQAREHIEDIESGRRDIPGKDPSPSAFRQYLVATKAKLKELCGMALQADEARAANAADEASIARLQEDLKASLAAFREKCFDPLSMQFNVD
jgi:hypothetical protein